MSAAAAAARTALEAAGRLPDDEIDLLATALQFARIDRPDLDPAPAQAFVSEMVGEAIAAMRNEGEGRLAAMGGIAAVLHRRHGFEGDRDDYDNPDNANLLAVLQRRRGLPVALGLLWVHLAEAAGAECHGLDLPGHFLLAFGRPGDRVICDAFDGGRLVAIERPGLAVPARLREAVPMTKRAILLRLQNNIRVRRAQAGESESALACLLDMLRLAPEAAALWLDAAAWQEAAGETDAAWQSLGHLERLAVHDEALAHAAQGLRERLVRRRAGPLRGGGNASS